MSSDDKYLKRYKEPYQDKDDAGDNRADWNTREGMMSEEEVERLAAERGKPEIGKTRADQSGEVGPEPEGNPTRRADQEAGPSGKLRRERAEEDPDNPPVPAKDWTKYDWD